MSNKLLSSLLISASFFALGGCGGGDKAACVNGQDKAALQACNRECARDDQEACAKAKVLEAQGVQ